MKNKKGFTLVEILSVIVIIAILSGVVIVAVNRYRLKNKEDFNKAVENTLVSNAKDYYSENLVELPNGRLEENSPRYIDVLWASELLSKGYYTNEIVDSDENNCSYSYVVVENNGSNSYTYTPCVVCENGYNTESEICNFVPNGSNINNDSNSDSNGDSSSEDKKLKCSIEITNDVNGYVSDDKGIAVSVSSENDVALFVIDGVNVPVTTNSITRYIDKDINGLLVTIYDTENNIGSCSYDGEIKIDRKTPSVTLASTKKSAGTTVSSGTWSTEGLNFTLTANEDSIGPSGATIYYCKDTENTCDPTTAITSGSAITSYNTTTGTYYIRYKILSGAGKSSETYSWTAKVDTTSPSITWYSSSGAYGNFKCTDSESGIYRYWLEWKKSTSSSWTKEVDTTYTSFYTTITNSVKIWSVGTHNVYVWCKNNAGLSYERYMNFCQTSYQGSFSGGTCSSSGGGSSSSGSGSSSPYVYNYCNCCNSHPYRTCTASDTAVNTSTCSVYAQNVTEATCSSYSD